MVSRRASFNWLTAGIHCTGRFRATNTLKAGGPTVCFYTTVLTVFMLQSDWLMHSVHNAGRVTNMTIKGKKGQPLECCLECTIGSPYLYMVKYFDILSTTFTRTLPNMASHYVLCNKLSPCQLKFQCRKQLQDIWDHKRTWKTGLTGQLNNRLTSRLTYAYIWAFTQCLASQWQNNQWRMGKMP